jgi:hypothetical protein
LLLGVGLETLPRKATADKVHKHIPETLEVIAPTLFNANVSVDARIPRRPREIFVLAVGNVLMSFGVSVLLRQAKIDDMDDLRALA